MRYRAIVLTGASGGLGHALAERLAAPGVAMLLCGRNAARLAEARDAAVAKGADVTLAPFAMQDHGSMAEALLGFDDAHGVDLIVANAGVKAGNENGVETAGTAARVVEVNLTGTIWLVECLLGKMTTRGTGRIAILSSLAAIAPQADLISYSASKAGLRGYGTALRRALGATGVGVSVVTPGFIDTPMTDRQQGPTPLTLGVADAADRIVRGLERRQNLIAFPLALVAISRLGNLLPTGIADWFNARFRSRILPDEDEISDYDRANR